MSLKQKEWDGNGNGNGSGTGMGNWVVIPLYAVTNPPGAKTQIFN